MKTNTVKKVENVQYHKAATEIVNGLKSVVRGLDALRKVDGDRDDRPGNSTKAFVAGAFAAGALTVAVDRITDLSGQDESKIITGIHRIAKPESVYSAMMAGRSEALDAEARFERECGGDGEDEDTPERDLDLSDLADLLN